MLIKKFLWIVSPLQIMMCGVYRICVWMFCATYLFIYVSVMSVTWKQVFC